ncbi:MAG: hypothetical protein AABX27_00160 [Nanoarchaeota archaeon]
MKAPTGIIIVAFALILSASLAAALSSFSISLHYDKGNVAPGEVQLLEREPPDFFHEPEEGYTAKVIAFNGSELYSRNFDFGLWAYDNPGVLDVADVQLILPSFNIMNELHLIDETGKLISTVDLSRYAVCNQNGICNSDYGETLKTCEEDCRAGMPVGEEKPSAEKQVGEAPAEEPVQEEKPAVFNKDYLLIGALALVFVIIVIALLVSRKKQAPQ